VQHGSTSPATAAAAPSAAEAAAAAAGGGLAVPIYQYRQQNRYNYMSSFGETGAICFHCAFMSTYWRAQSYKQDVSQRIFSELHAEAIPFRRTLITASGAENYASVDTKSTSLLRKFDFTTEQIHLELHVLQCFGYHSIVATSKEDTRGHQNRGHRVTKETEGDGVRGTLFTTHARH